jgi:hypothetical protein
MAGREAHGEHFVNQLSLFAVGTDPPHPGRGVSAPPPTVGGPRHFVYLHGFGSSPASPKATALRTAFREANVPLATPNVAVPTFATMTISAALEVIAREAALYAARHPERVAGLALLCPGFEMTERFRGLLGERGMRRWKNRGSIAYPDADKKLTALHYGLFADAATFEAMPAPPPGVPVTIIHGRADVVVPIDVSRRYVERYRDAAPRLIEVDDDHRLEESLADVTRAIGEAFGLPLEPSVENRDLPRG